MKIVYFLVFNLVLLTSGFGQSAPTKKYKSFASGEQIKYKLKYGIILAGEGTVELKLSSYEEKPVYHASIVAQTKGIADKLFSVKDIYESYFDTKTGLPVKAIRNIKEGNYRFYDEVFYNHKDCVVYSQKRDSVYRVPPGIHDMVSTLYYLRSMNIDKYEKGEVFEVVTFFDDAVFPFKFRYKGTEMIKTKFGRINCYRFDPVVEPGRIFKTEDDMTIWISADRNLIPIMVKFDMLISSLKCEIDDFTNLKYDLKFE
jgi:hypothetical protein